MNNIEVFARGETSLGEAPLWHPQRQSLFWIDINNQQLFEKKFNNTNEFPDETWSLPEIGSALAVDETDKACLWIVTDYSFGRFSLKTGYYEAVIKLESPDGFRSNDGGVAPDGTFWFGTMEKEPTGLHGSVYAISQNGGIDEVIRGVGIPNTFCWLDNGASLFLSDSYRQQMFVHNVSGRMASLSRATQPFIDLSNGEATPDGGSMDESGNIWNSQWDGFRVACYSRHSELIDVVDLPIPRPTSCCFGGPQNSHLFITTAKEGLNREKLIQYPLSGSVLVADLSDIKGQPIPPFSMKGLSCLQV